MTHRFLTTLVVLLTLTAVPLSGTAQCANTHVHNATFIVPPSVAAESFDSSATVTATTKEHDVCVAESTGDSAGVALAIRENDDVVNTESIDGATPEESFVLHADDKSVMVGFEEPTLDIEKTETVYERGATYTTSSFEILPADSSDLSFEADTLYTTQDTASVGVSVTLPSADTLSGVQFDIPFDGPIPTVSKSYDKGTLQTNEISTDTLRVLLYTMEAEDLPNDSVVTVNADVTTEGQTLGLTNAYATTGGANSTVEVDLNIGTSPLYVEEGETDIVVQTDSLTYTETTVGDATDETIAVENQGSVDGTVSLSTTSTVFTAPENASVPAGSTTEVPVTFVPAYTTYGEQSATVSVTNGEQTTDVSASGLGVGGRGDPTLSGAVNVSDVVMIADIILGQISPDTTEQSAADVYPLEDNGNGTINISDLQATSNAILNGTWGDDVDLALGTPTQKEPVQTAKKKKTQSEIILEEPADKNTTKVLAVGTGSARGLQIKLDRKASKESHEELTIREGVQNGGSRLLVYQKNGNPLPDDTLHIATIQGGGKAEVDRALKAGVLYGTHEMDVKRIKNVGRRGIQVYPNPTRSQTTVQLSLKNQQEGRLEVYDSLGRKVQTVASREFRKGKRTHTLDASKLSSGMYFVRFRAENYSETKKMTVVRYPTTPG